MSENRIIKTLTQGLIKENPTLKMILGMCPALAVTTSAQYGVSMGLAATAVLVGSNFVISLIRKLVPDKVRIPVFITVIAGFVTAVQLILQAYFKSLYDALGIFIPLIVVNCIILARAEMFASKNNPGMSILDGISMGAGFTIALFMIGSIREILGAGTWMGLELTSRLFSPAVIMILPPGGFMVFGFLIAAINKLSSLNIRNTIRNKEIMGACDMNCAACIGHGGAKE